MRGSGWRSLPGSCVLALALLTTSCESFCRGVLVYDIGPDMKNGLPLPPTEDTTAGVTLRVDGNTEWLYAVSLNAGVFRSVAGVSGGPWIQLSKSPPRAYSLAVDRNDVKHVVVGERDGDNADPATNDSGVWESFDGGTTWQKTFDPRSLNAACGSQAIPSVAISASGTVVAATNCGIAVQPKGGSWSYAGLPAGFPANRVTAVASSQTRVWARDDQYNLVWSDAGAQTFSFVTQNPHPPAVPGAIGDDGTLAVVDSLAVMVCLGDPVPDDQNLTRLLIYDVATDRWTDQRQIDFSVQDPNGNVVPAKALNGNGGFKIGRRFAKAYVVDRRTRWGHDLQLFVSNAQEVYRATARRRDGTFAFERVAGTPDTNGGSLLPNWAGVSHRDLWDFHLARDGKAAWLASDGGVAETLLDGQGWHLRSQSLHTHHVQSIYVPFDELHAAFVTQDNDSWIRTKPGTEWAQPGGLGDSNFVVGDRGDSTAVLLVRRIGQAVLCGFGAKLPTSQETEVYGIVVNNDTAFEKSPLALRAIQTRKGESFAKPLDVVMLTRLPFVWEDAAGSHEIVAANGQAFALVRNQDFEANADVNLSEGRGWALAAGNLPASPVGFWVTGARNGPGAHAEPIYYLLANPAGALTLFRSSGGPNSTTWTAVPSQPTNIVGDGSNFRNGPVFVNPYDADVVYVLTSTGVMVSRNATSANATFTSDHELSRLISASGKYPFAAGIEGGNRTNVDRAVHNGGRPTETLSDMAFDYDDPSHVVASSPFTGASVNLGSGWRDLGPYLPKPLSPVVSVAIVDRRVYVGTMGRGILMLTNVDEARPPVREGRPDRASRTPG